MRLGKRKLVAIFTGVALLFSIMGNGKELSAATSDGFSLELTTLAVVNTRSTIFNLGKGIEIKSASLFEECMRNGFAFQLQGFNLTTAGIKLGFGLNPTYSGTFTLFHAEEEKETTSMTLSFEKLSDSVKAEWTMDEDPANEFIERFHSNVSGVEIITVPKTNNKSGEPQKFKFIFRDGMQSDKGASFQSSLISHGEDCDIYHVMANDGTSDYEYEVYIVDTCPHSHYSWVHSDNADGKWVYQCDVCKDVLRSLTPEEYEAEILNPTPPTISPTPPTTSPTPPTISPTPPTTSPTPPMVSPTPPTASQVPSTVTTPTTPPVTSTVTPTVMPTVTATVMPTAMAAEPEQPAVITKDNVIYQRVSKDEVIVKGVTSKKLKVIKIGQTLAKGNCTYSVVGIKERAFEGCKKLKKLILKSGTIKTVGNNALKKVNKNLVIQVPKSRKKGYCKLFTKKTGFKRSMKIK